MSENDQECACADYGEWIDEHPVRILNQELFKNAPHYEGFADVVKSQLRAIPLVYTHGESTGKSRPMIERSSILELGCGTGIVANMIGSCNYLGVTDSVEEYKIAQKKCPENKFLLMNMHDVHRIKMDADIVLSKGILKNFKREEFKDLLKIFLSKGKIGIFTVPIGKQKSEECCDTITSLHFHHTWINVKDLQKAIKMANHKLITPLKNIKMGEENIIITERIKK